MNTLDLLKKMTAVKNLSVILILTLSFFSYADETVGSGTNSKSDYEVDSQCRFRLGDKEDEFNKACAKAKLGQGDLCVERIEACNDIEDDDDSEDITDSGLTYCPKITAATSRQEKRLEKLEKSVDKADEKEEKIKEEIEKLTEDYHEANDEANQLVEERNTAQEEYNQLMAEVDQEKSEALNNARQQVEDIQLEIEQTQDRIRQQWLSLRQFITENKLQCRERAVQIASEETQRNLNNKRTGRSNYNQRSFIALGKRGAIDLGREEHDKYMRSCTSVYDPYNNRQATAFGDQYILRRANMKDAIRILERNILRLERRKEVAKNYYQQALANLDSKERNAVVAALNKQESINRRSQQLRNKMINVQYKLFQASQKLNEHQNRQRVLAKNLRDVENSVMLKLDSGHSSTDDQREAFYLAESLMKYNDRAGMEARDCNFDNKTVAGISSDIEDVSIPSVDTDPAISGDRSPATPAPVGGADSTDSSGSSTDSTDEDKLCYNGAATIITCPDN